MLLMVSLSPAMDRIYYIDNFSTGKLYRIEEASCSAGGKGVNAARVASQLGEHVALTGFKAGNTGELLETAMRQRKIGCSFIQAEGETRTNLNIIDRSSGHETEILEAGPQIGTTEAEAFKSLFSSLLPSTEVIVFSGGLPRGLPEDFYAGLIKQAGKAGKRVLFDSSGNMLRYGVEASPYLVKPNLRELGQYAGREISAVEEITVVSRQLITDCGVKIAVTSMGVKGAVLVTEDRAYLGKVPVADVINTIGCGDSMVAGFAVGLSRGLNTEDMFRLGLACAAANTQSPLIGWADRDSVESYFSLAEIEPILL